jgi:cytochrome P450
MIPIGLDPPEHTVFRRLLNGEFSPARVAGLEADMSVPCRELIDGVRARAPVISSRLLPAGSRRPSSCDSWLAH